MLGSKLPVQKTSQNADLDDNDEYEDNFVGEYIEIHLLEYSSAPPQLDISFHQPENTRHYSITQSQAMNLFLVLSRVSL